MRDRDLRGLPLEARKAVLERVVPETLEYTSQPVGVVRSRPESALAIGTCAFMSRINTTAARARTVPRVRDRL